jgi:hypothetical protein
MRPGWRRELEAYRALGAAQDRVHAAVVRFGEVAAAYGAAAGCVPHGPAGPKSAQSPAGNLDNDAKSTR